MTRAAFILSLGAAALLATPAAAATWVPASEIVGQTVQVETNGTINSINFKPGGSAEIMTPAGRVVPASWTASGGKLCLLTGGASECVAYSQPFQAGQSVTVTSDCGSTSRWLANAVNTAPAPEPKAAGERG
jgi:hypothetical protein